MAKTLLAVVFLSANLLHFPQGPARARRLVEALLGRVRTRSLRAFLVRDTITGLLKQKEPTGTTLRPSLTVWSSSLSLAHRLAICHAYSPPVLALKRRL